MPEMGGLETTAVIRTKEKDGAGHVPILAMTAHALKGDRERCLAAGMDGYISKPIRPQEMFRAIENLNLAPEWPPTRPDSDILDRREVLYRFDDDMELLREAVLDFLEECPGDWRRFGTPWLAAIATRSRVWRTRSKDPSATSLPARRLRQRRSWRRSVARVKSLAGWRRIRSWTRRSNGSSRRCWLFHSQREASPLELTYRTPGPIAPVRSSTARANPQSSATS